jgi:hypothetical protein
MLATRRSVGQFILQYRTDGQYDHTKTWACVRKAQSTETLRATPKVVPRGPTIMSAIPPEAAERVPAQWRNTEQRPLKRCVESRQRMPGSGCRTFRTCCGSLPMSVVGELTGPNSAAPEGRLLTHSWLTYLAHGWVQQSPFLTRGLG